MAEFVPMLLNPLAHAIPPAAYAPTPKGSGLRPLLAFPQRRWYLAQHEESTCDFGDVVVPVGGHAGGRRDRDLECQGGPGWTGWNAYLRPQARRRQAYRHLLGR